jgi:hypothetical protein
MRYSSEKYVFHNCLNHFSDLACRHTALMWCHVHDASTFDPRSYMLIYIISVAVHVLACVYVSRSMPRIEYVDCFKRNIWIYIFGMYLLRSIGSTITWCITTGQLKFKPNRSWIRKLVSKCYKEGSCYSALGSEWKETRRCIGVWRPASSAVLGLLYITMFV